MKPKKMDFEHIAFNRSSRSYASKTFANSPNETQLNINTSDDRMIIDQPANTFNSVSLDQPNVVTQMTFEMQLSQKIKRMLANTEK